MKSQLKYFLNQLLVVMSFISFNLLSPVAQAQASTPFSQDWVSDTNYAWTLESSIDNLKSWFKTKEDHREIDAAFNQLKKQKLDWKLVQDNNGAIFLLNGEPAFHFDAFNKESATVNGTVVSFKKGVSFKKFVNDFTNAIKKKDYSLNSLFINEADAILPFLIGALVIGGIALAASSANAGQNCSVPSHPYCESLDRSKFKNGRKCNDMPTNYQRRLKLVSDQFKSNAKFNQNTNTSYRYSEACIVKYQEVGRPAAVQLCKCIYKKQRNCAPDNSSAGSPLYGWNMTEQMAEQTCMVAYRYWKEPCTTNTPPVDTPTPPTTCGKTSGGCNNPPVDDTPIEDTPTPDTHRPKTSN